eukprot:scaffold62365_cov44-Cyclotella_meneghiniana.AAC.2
MLLHSCNTARKVLGSDAYPVAVDTNTIGLARLLNLNITTGHCLFPSTDTEMDWMEFSKPYCQTCCWNHLWKSHIPQASFAAGRCTENLSANQFSVPGVSVDTAHPSNFPMPETEHLFVQSYPVQPEQVIFSKA